jgi:hypothetical protein
MVALASLFVKGRSSSNAGTVERGEVSFFLRFNTGTVGAGTVDAGESDAGLFFVPQSTAATVETVSRGENFADPGGVSSVGAIRGSPSVEPKAGVSRRRSLENSSPLLNLVNDMS